MSNTRVKGSNQKRTVPTAQQSSESLELQIASFLNSGGIIEEIPRGVSGQIFTPATKKP
ncbi:MAG: hypothetical protein M0Q98_01350 [Pseudomonas sp.]|jgi:hypothetical protein|nr:hypothetical protein [Pseudomonas sp.]MDD2221874.1 hypothetical protein [Pseudomonas sp.]MDY0413457.1 hypothetical protein [Pseudomonas sp.]NLO54541.1 hypothetical protein [Gammaproteobacteria bacterium]